MTDLLNNWYAKDAIVLVVLGIMGWIGTILMRREVWRSAMRQVFRRRMVRVSAFILALYTLIAILDSVGYHPPLRNADASLRRHTESGRILFDRDGMSVLDLLLTPLRHMEEKTYSAPLATTQFTMETLYADDGTTTRDCPPLRYPRRHLLGTDRVGNDVLLLSIKGIRTGMIIGGFTTLLVIPFAILFGVTAGYLRGWVDDVIQYIYTVLSSIPSLLLIISFMIVFGRGLTQLCIIMGITSWTGLCRVLRGETLKLRELEYVQAAEAMGVSRARIMFQHIVPNLMHIVLITAVLSFSGRVLAEAVLSYIGIGVGADTMSWGTMINDARQELARAPIIWWKLVAAFVFMVGLVLPANLFGDALRAALDPRLRTE
jgi:ABC-type dipeptide/oligopeptide/nickel transport system permease subunit